jgi:hypothetical protein
MRFYRNGSGIVVVDKNLDFPETTAEEFEAELAEMTRRGALRRELEERSRPLTTEEVGAMLITHQINTLEVDDNTALRMKGFYPEWVACNAYAVGFKVKYNGNLWRAVQEHTSQIGWEPENAASLWEQINETHSGTIDDPIPYSGNMALENGKHYVQDYVIYLCNRDTVNPVYNFLSDLVGLYVEKV